MYHVLAHAVRPPNIFWLRARPFAAVARLIISDHIESCVKYNVLLTPCVRSITRVHFGCSLLSLWRVCLTC